jgi:hypothetical protein
VVCLHSSVSFDAIVLLTIFHYFPYKSCTWYMCCCKALQEIKIEGTNKGRGYRTIQGGFLVRSGVAWEK